MVRRVRSRLWWRGNKKYEPRGPIGRRSCRRADRQRLRWHRSQHRLPQQALVPTARKWRRQRWSDRRSLRGPWTSCAGHRSPHLAQHNTVTSNESPAHLGDGTQHVCGCNQGGARNGFSPKYAAAVADGSPEYVSGKMSGWKDSLCRHRPQHHNNKGCGQETTKKERRRQPKELFTGELRNGVPGHPAERTLRGTIKLRGSTTEVLVSFRKRAISHWRDRKKDPSTGDNNTK